MISNGNSFSSGNSFGFAAADDQKVRSLPYWFRLGVPGYQGGWPAR